MTKIEVYFSYQESVQHVYKKVAVYINGQKKTIRALKHLFGAVPDIMTANTYFWKPGTNAASRRCREKQNIEAVSNWLKSKGFDVTVKDNEIKAVLIQHDNSIL